MFKNITSLTIAAALGLTTLTACILVTDDGVTTDSDTVAETTTGDGDGDGDTTTGDGDGDTTTGDGDGDTATGDGDGDPATGDGDGDPGTDTDTDTTTTDTDTDSDTDTAPANLCGWDVENSYYECGFEGEDPGGENPIGCPDGLIEGDPCANSGLSGQGCCDANGDNWYCAQGEVVVFASCGG